MEAGVGPLLEVGEGGQAAGQIGDLGGMIGCPALFGFAVALGSGGFDAVALGQGVADDAVDVLAQLQVASFGRLSASDFHGRGKARPGDVLAAGGCDQAWFVDLELVPQGALDEQGCEDLGLAEVLQSTEFDAFEDLVVLGRDLPQGAGVVQEAGNPGEFSKPRVRVD
ncbi:hypothetical protein PV396_42610 [Streptomyces sp. ME02-8801-2C]|uniref:hypothetical protein n=1 Tax=Streptomyces sp. ME02-8801-2C TaxID=3028680 RepID=UPI0029BAD3F7|nr:hypothetical protein [Streptomyces sp. ME02-8801-2C]MDX3458556.1 hypothetical protein [Streptomyces sp. ME02-8801-2C]